MEPNSPKKIQFSVPLFQSQIDPEAAEQIRKRRPTPASLVIMNEHVPPEKDEKRTNISQAESQSASPKQRKQSVFTPPALKGTVQAAVKRKIAKVVGCVSDHRKCEVFLVKTRGSDKSR
ncbi:PREDICTED: protein phosphatase 1 regulatory subunit 1C-like, partial [Fulmarus glacialis]